MKLVEIFKQLTHGELSQLNIGGAAAGEINEDNYEKVLAHINLGLVALYTRFPLKTSTVSVEIQANQTVYPLDEDDLLKIDEVRTDEGDAFPLNNEFDPYSINTPSPKVLEVPQRIVMPSTDTPTMYLTDSLHVKYRASLPIISIYDDGFDPEQYEVELPYNYLQALLYFVAGRVNAPYGAANGYSAGDSYENKYEMECQRLMLYMPQVETVGQPNRLREKGWV